MLVPKNAALAALAVVVLAAPGVLRAQSSAVDNAVLGELNPDKRAEVQSRATAGNTVRTVLETMLLNNIKLQYPANRIVALDFGRGVAVVETAENRTCSSPVTMGLSGGADEALD